MTADDVFTASANLLNDPEKTEFTNAVQMPFLNIAIGELNESAELENVPLTNASETDIDVDAGVDNIGGMGGPALPDDLIEIQQLFERTADTDDDYQEMTRTEFLPAYTTHLPQLIYWSWYQQIIHFISATSNRQVRINYIRKGIPEITAEDDDIDMINAKSFLSYRTAALCAQFIGENKERADDLNTFAQLALDRLLGINAKGRQSITTRRRPFMASYKANSGGRGGYSSF